MPSPNPLAVQICGIATLVVVAVSGMTLGALHLGIDGVPFARATMGIAVLVAFVAFLLANTSNRDIAKAVCVGSVALIAILGALRVYAFLVAGVLSTSGVADTVFAIAVALLLVPLVRSAWREATPVPRALS